MIQLLFQADASGAELHLAQLYGLALVGLGWMASKPCPRSAQRGCDLQQLRCGAFVRSDRQSDLRGPGGMGGCLPPPCTGVLMIIDQLQHACPN